MSSLTAGGRGLERTQWRTLDPHPVSRGQEQFGTQIRDAGSPEVGDGLLKGHVKPNAPRADTWRVGQGPCPATLGTIPKRQNPELEQVLCLPSQSCARKLLEWNGPCENSWV